MKVALVTYGLSIGGMETFLFSLARALRACGAEPTFVVTDYVGEWHHRPVDEGFEVLAEIPQWRESRYGHANRLARTLGCFDVVILNHCRPAQCAVSKLPESTVAISVLHDSAREIYRVGLANTAALDAVVAVSAGVRADALSYGASPEKTRTITHGIDMNLGHVTKHECGEAAVSLAFVGRLETQKGVVYLPRIISALSSTGVNARLDIVGDGREAETLKKEFAGYEEKVSFHGALPHARAMDVLSRANVLLLPSEHEGLGLVLLEAMSRGVIPVASRLPGVTDSIVEHGVDGFLAAVGDIDAFAAAISALSDIELRERMSEAARARAIRDFTVDTMAQKYLALIEDCRKNRRTGNGPVRSGKIEASLLGKRCRVPLLFHNAGWMVKSLLRRRAN